jgi:hypothetical protein
MGIPMNPWSIGREHVISIRFNVWTYTQNNKSNQTKPKMCEQHKTLCYEYKNATLLEKQMFAM